MRDKEENRMGESDREGEDGKEKRGRGKKRDGRKVNSVFHALSSSPDFTFLLSLSSLFPSFLPLPLSHSVFSLSLKLKFVLCNKMIIILKKHNVR